MDYKIQTIDYYSPDNMPLYEAIAALVAPINETYAGHNKWLREKFFPGLKDGSRKIIIAQDETGYLAGAALLKDTEEEKKICCLFVRETCRGNGIATRLMQESLTALNTDKPLLTVSDKNYPQLKRLLELYGTKFSYRKRGAYKADDTEYYFNNAATEDLKEKILNPLFAGAFRKHR